jgi:hypothetical protein
MGVCPFLTRVSSAGEILIWTARSFGKVSLDIFSPGSAAWRTVSDPGQDVRQEN